MKDTIFAGLSIGGVLALIAVPVAAWTTHLIWIIRTLASDLGATVGQMVLGAIGAFMPPVGVVHGLLIWFGSGF